MNVTGSFDSTTRGTSKCLAIRPRIVEKSSSSNMLGEQPQDFTPTGDTAAPHLRVEIVSQNVTLGFDRFWDGPRLTPTFVVQLLGQVMAADQLPMNSAQAYGAAAPRQARLLDRKS